MNVTGIQSAQTNTGHHQNQKELITFTPPGKLKNILLVVIRFDLMQWQWQFGGNVVFKNINIHASLICS